MNKMSADTVTSLVMFDRQYRGDSSQILCGIDEAGRGPLAGPVVAAAVIFGPDTVIEGLNDSKKLTEKKREALFPVICENAVAYGIGFASEKEIDEINILNATYLAMRRAYDEMKRNADLVLVDGNRDPGFHPNIFTIVKGDAKSQVIAAASVLAKVSRDRYMLDLAKKYPEYQFEKHKGYPTKDHYQKIMEYGISDVHRRSFLKDVINGTRNK